MIYNSNTRQNIVNTVELPCEYYVPNSQFRYVIIAGSLRGAKIESLE